jgi:enoyl-CoA hydratase/carnithine racemase
LSRDLIAALKRALDQVAAEHDVKVVVLEGIGERIFCAGHDLKELSLHRADADRGRAFFEKTFAVCGALMQAIVRNPKPVIAEVGGIATAAGCQLVASCDLAVASTSARFATPGVDIGLFCSTPMVALSRNVGRKAAMEMLLTGRMVEAEDARAMGLVNKVVAPEILESETMVLANKIASKPRQTLKTGKEAFYRQLEMPLAEAYAYASQVMTENMLAAEACEGIGAFIEKRKPKWPS